METTQPPSQGPRPETPSTAGAPTGPSGQAPSYPISYDAAYEIERDRLTTFFRLLVAIPWILWMYLYGIAALVVMVIAWFVLLFTKKFPTGMYEFIAGYLRLNARVLGFAALLTDAFPPFHGNRDPSYPIKVDVGPPQAEYSRAKTFFKYVLAFPQMVLGFGMGGLVSGGAFVTWFRVLATGKQSITMHEALRAGAAYSLRSQGFTLLLTEAHPRPLDLPRQEPPPNAPALPPPGVAPGLGAGS